MTPDEAEDILENELSNLGKRKTAKEMEKLNEAVRILEVEIEKVLESLPEKLREQIKRRL